MLTFILKIPSGQTSLGPFNRKLGDLTNMKLDIKRNNNKVCMPGRFNANISHQLFDFKITFVNLQRKNTNSKDHFI